MPNRMQAIRLLIEVNFYFAVVALMFASICSVTDASFFEFNEALYGALDNNLRMMMVNLGITEAVVLGYCWFSKSFRYMVLVGFFLLLMIGSLEFYGEVNTVAIDANFSLFFMYTGLSHMLFGLLKTGEKKPVAQD